PAAGGELSPNQVEQVKKEISAAPKQFEFHGYFRSGAGINGKGGDQEAQRKRRTNLSDST
ncbi:MAG TPA: hypothetical protein VN253_26065, partial [Kofleriaceae bacterium]|nr:hypothetical protein [Kofleriaceae bacterium]